MLSSCGACETNQEVVERVRTAFFNENGKLRHRALSLKWHVANGTEQAFLALTQITSFLDIEASTRERLLYLEMNRWTPILCNWCGVRQCRAKLGGTPKFFQSCLHQDCLRKQKSWNVESVWANQNPQERQRRCENIGQSLAKSLSEKVYSEEERAAAAMRASGKKQTQEVKAKRIASRKSNGLPWFSEATKAKLAESNRITHTSEEFKRKHEETYKRSHVKISHSMKQNIILGVFTPPITNSWTHWSAYAVNTSGVMVKFRSSWEAGFWLVTKLEYEKIRIPYQFGEAKKVYIVDFHDSKNRILYEVKPNSARETAKNAAKAAAAQEWCLANNYTYEIIGDDWFRNNLLEEHLIGNDHLKEKLKKVLCKQKS